MKKVCTTIIIFCALFLFSACSDQSENSTSASLPQVTQETTVTEDTMVTGTSSSFSKESFGAQGYTVNYWLYTPENPQDNMPLIVYLHGGTSKGDDLDLLIQKEGFPQYIYQGKLNVPAYIVMPQAPQELGLWDEMNSEVISLVSSVAEQYKIDKENISLTGHSMGGIGTWLVGYDNMDVFARIAPLSGSVSRQLRDSADEITIPVWSFVGTDQSDSKAYNSNTEFFPELEKYNQSVRLTILQGYKHREVVRAYLEYDIIDWLIGLG